MLKRDVSDFIVFIIMFLFSGLSTGSHITSVTFSLNGVGMNGMSGLQFQLILLPVIIQWMLIQLNVVSREEEILDWNLKKLM